MCIKNGIIYGDYMTSYSVMAVKKDGTIYTPAQGLMGKNLLAAGVKDTYNFGPILIKDGEAQLPWAETEKYYPRTAEEHKRNRLMNRYSTWYKRKSGEVRKRKEN